MNNEVDTCKINPITTHHLLVVVEKLGDAAGAAGAAGRQVLVLGVVGQLLLRRAALITAQSAVAGNI